MHWLAAPHQSIGLVLASTLFSFIMCSFYYSLDRAQHSSCDYYWDFYSQYFYFELQVKAFWNKVVLVLQTCTSLNVSTLDISFEFWIEYVTFGLLYVMFRFSTRIVYRGVPGFATDAPCGVWCRGLTTCLLFVGPRLENLVSNESGFVCLT